MVKLNAIEIDNVSKTFKKNSEPASTLKDRVISFRKSEVTTFNALKDISFNVGLGESVGILGHNGSGKSTLLKTIAGTLRPSTGSIKVRGSLAALLELGAGFHPDLTGKENIYLNGSVLGFSKGQIDEIFDEIVDFSELHDFIHTQVKHYSSGMYARLGFAVAINLQPDILLIDEVLAVGDEAFQRKCKQRIGQFQKRGRTLILVTHSPEEVVKLCDKAVVLDHGNIIFQGDVNEAMVAYRKSIHGENYTELNLGEDQTAQQDGSIFAEAATVTSLTGEPVIMSGDHVQLDVDFHVNTDLAGDLRLLVHDHDGVEILNLSSLNLGKEVSFSRGSNKFGIDIESLPLCSGLYNLSFVMTDSANEILHGSGEKITNFVVENRSVNTGRIAIAAKVKPNEKANR